MVETRMQIDSNDLLNELERLKKASDELDKKGGMSPNLAVGMFYAQLKEWVDRRRSQL